MVLNLKDQLNRKTQEMEQLMQQLETRNEHHQPSKKRASSQPPTKRTRSISLESGEIFSDNALMSEDESLPDIKENTENKNATDDNEVVTVGMLRKILQEVLQPQPKDSLPSKGKKKDQYQDPKSYARVAATPPVATTRPRRVRRPVQPSSRNERKHLILLGCTSAPPEPITRT